jgi:hypothetical protein
MNSITLIQQAMTRWLALPDQGAMDPSGMRDLLLSLNAAQSAVWRALPVHYKKQAMSLEFYGPATGTVVVAGYGLRGLSGVAFPSIQDILTYQGEPLFFDGEPLLFNGESVMESPRPYCRIDVAGDQSNIFDGTALRHPYLGQQTGTVGATLCHDAKLSPVMIERIVSPVIDRVSRQDYFQVERHDERYNYGPKSFAVRRIQHAGVMRTLVELTPGHSAMTVLAFDALVAPVPLTLGSSVRPVDLPYDDEVAGFIVAMAGEGLSTHRWFDRSRFTRQDAIQSTASSWKQVGGLAVDTQSTPHGYGTPHGH